MWSLTWTSLKVIVKDQGQQGQKQHFSALLAACVRFMFGKTSLASGLFLVFEPEISVYKSQCGIGARILEIQ